MSVQHRLLPISGMVMTCIALLLEPLFAWDDDLHEAWVMVSLVGFSMSAVRWFGTETMRLLEWHSTIAMPVVISVDVLTLFTPLRLLDS